MEKFRRVKTGLWIGKANEIMKKCEIYLNIPNHFANPLI